MSRPGSRNSRKPTSDAPERAPTRGPGYCRMSYLADRAGGATGAPRGASADPRLPRRRAAGGPRGRRGHGPRGIYVLCVDLHLNETAKIS